MKEWLLALWRDRYGTRDFSPSEAARLTGATRQALSRVRDDDGEPDFETVQRIAQGFGVPVPRLERCVVLDQPLDPRTPVGWISEAEVAIARAKALLIGSTSRDERQKIEDIELLEAVEEQERIRQGGEPPPQGGRQDLTGTDPDQSAVEPGPLYKAGRRRAKG